MATNSTDGPRPKVDAADENMRRSRDRLAAATPPDRFVFRMAGGDDKGVDFHLDLLNGGNAYGFSVAGQLKAEAVTEPNRDGSFSYSIETSNLNLLLDYPFAIYVHFAVDRNEFRFAWAIDEQMRLERDEVEWQEQGSFTIRFEKFLDAAGWDEIHRRLLAEGRRLRVLREQLAQTAVGQSTIQIDLQTSEVTTGDDAFERIRDHGVNLVAAGYGRVVEGWFGLLTRQQQEEPSVILALAYAAFHSGNPHKARGILAPVLPRRSEFQPFERTYADLLLNSIRLQLGQIEDSTYEQEVRRLEGEAPEPLATQLKFDRLRWEHLAERDDIPRRQRARALEAVAASMLRDPNIPETLRVQVRIVQFQANAADLQSDLATRIAYSQVRLATGQPLSQHEVAEWQNIRAQRAAVNEQGTKLLAEANKLGHPRLQAEAAMAQMVYLVMTLTEARLVLSGMRMPVPDLPDVGKQVGEQELLRVAALFKSIGDVGGEIRAALLLAQWHEVNGKPAAASTAANSVRGIAEAMGLDDELRQIDTVINGNSPYRTVLKQLANSGDLDYRHATQSDEDARRLAGFELGRLGLPQDRLPVIERAALVVRNALLEKYDWCQHFELLEEQTYRGSRQLQYATDPTWQAECVKHKRRSLIPLADAAFVIDAFKRCHCATCPDRCPRSKPAT